MQIEATKVFGYNWKATKKIVVNRGGTRSSKTYSICQQLAMWLMTGKVRADKTIPKGVASVVRKYGTTLKNTVMRDFEEVLKDNNLYQYVQHHKTDRTYTYDGRMVEFFGADDQQKIRGYKSDILYCNEANELGFKTEFFQLSVRTKELIIIDFNPSDPYIWINEELEQKRASLKGDVEVIVSTYQDNRFLSKGQIEEIEYLKQTDQELWQVYGLGEYGKVHGLIFPNVTLIDELPEGLKKRGYGMDFGFTNDPTTLIHGGILHGNCLYLDEVLWERGLTNHDISNRLAEKELSRSDEVFADSAEPKSIKEIKEYGWNVKPVKKGKDSIKFGIDTLKQYHIHITKRSTNLLREQKKYKWKEKDGEWLNEPIDMFNHGWDAARYYAMSKIAKASKRGARFAGQQR